MGFERSLGESLGGGDGALEGGQDLSGVIEEHAPRREQGHAPRGAGKEGRTQLVLQGPDLPAERGLGDVQALGGAAHVAFFGDGDEVTELGETHGPEFARPGAIRQDRA